MAKGTAADTAYKKSDFAPSRGIIVFATGQGTKLSAEPTAEQMAAWNRRVRLPPAAVAKHFAESLKEVGVQTIGTVPRIIFSVSPKDPRNPVMIFELWHEGADIPDHYSPKNRQQRIGRATFLLESGGPYFDWINVTRDFNRAGDIVSLRQQGIGRNMLAAIMPLFMAMGYDSMELSAQSGRPNGKSEFGRFNKGAYVWPRFGFEVAPESKGIKIGLDQLPGRLQSNFDAAVCAVDLPAGLTRRIQNIIDHPDPQMLVKLAGIRREINDPDEPGTRTQLAEYLMRDLYVEGHFSLSERRWQNTFFKYVGIDSRPALDSQLQQWQKKSPS